MQTGLYGSHRKLPALARTTAVETKTEHSIYHLMNITLQHIFFADARSLWLDVMKCRQNGNKASKTNDFHPVLNNKTDFFLKKTTFTWWKDAEATRF